MSNLMESTRCATVTVATRADELGQGDVVVWAGFEGLELVTVAGLATEGEDVSVCFKRSNGLAFAVWTSPGNRFDVVTLNRSVCGPMAPDATERQVRAV